MILIYYGYAICQAAKIGTMMHRFIVISVIIALTGCTSSMDYADSPNFNPKIKMFQNSDGESNDKSLSELVDLA